MHQDDEFRYDVLAGGRAERDPRSAAADPEQTGRPGRPRRLGRVVGATAVVLAVVAGGAIYAAAQDDSAALPESVLPRTAFAFAKVDLEPGTAGRDGLTAFIRRFPLVAATSTEQLRDRAVTALVQPMRLEYATDVKPWLGRHAGLALFPDAQGKPTMAVALHTRDAAAAMSALARLRDAPAVARRGDYVVVAPDQQALDAALAETSDSPLGRDAEFAGDLAKLPGPQIAVVWTDNRPATDAYVREVSGEPSAEHDPFLTKMLAGADGRTVFGLHATPTYAEIEGFTTGRPAAKAGSLATVRALPDTTIAAAFAADGPAAFSGAGGGILAGFGIAGRLPGFMFGFSSLLFPFGGHPGDYSTAVPMPACTVSPAPSGQPADPCAAEPAPRTRPPEPAISPRPPPPAEPPPPTMEPPPHPAEITITTCPSPSRSADGMSATYCNELKPLPPDAVPGQAGWAEAPHQPFEDPMALLTSRLDGALSGPVTVALGSLPVPGSKSAPDLALIAPVKETAAADALAALVKDAITSRYSGAPYSRVDTGVLTVASRAEYAAKLGTGQLGQTKLFAAAMGDLGSDVEMAVFVNLEGVRDVASGYPREVLPVSAVGMSTARSGDDTLIRVRLVSR